jgi:hypothetical protein
MVNMKMVSEPSARLADPLRGKDINGMLSFSMRMLNRIHWKHIIRPNLFMKYALVWRKGCLVVASEFRRLFLLA